VASSPRHSLCPDTGTGRAVTVDRPRHNVNTSQPTSNVDAGNRQARRGEVGRPGDERAPGRQACYAAESREPTNRRMRDQSAAFAARAGRRTGSGSTARQRCWAHRTRSGSRTVCRRLGSPGWVARRPLPRRSAGSGVLNNSASCSRSDRSCRRTFDVSSSATRPRPRAPAATTIRNPGGHLNSKTGSYQPGHTQRRECTAFSNHCTLLRSEVKLVPRR